MLIYILSRESGTRVVGPIKYMRNPNGNDANQKAWFYHIDPNRVEEWCNASNQWHRDNGFWTLHLDDGNNVEATVSAFVREHYGNFDFFQVVFPDDRGGAIYYAYTRESKRLGLTSKAIPSAYEGSRYCK